MTDRKNAGTSWSTEFVDESATNAGSGRGSGSGSGSTGNGSGSGNGADATSAAASFSARTTRAWSRTPVVTGKVSTRSDIWRSLSETASVPDPCSADQSK
ncbi:MAG: hypothetical protein EBT04_06305 [Betaproteobacteria bacterium]|nr:hypothetical protein [Betaproteobacteria bacterium]